MGFQKCRRAACLLVIWLPLFACSESEEDGPIGTGYDGTVYGTATTGAPIANTNIVIKDQAGVKREVRSDAVGQFEFDINIAKMPYLLKAVATDNTTYFSVVTKSGITNINPLTDIVIRNWFLTRNRKLSSEFDNNLPIDNPPFVDKINAIVDSVVNLHTLTYESFAINNSFNFLQSEFAANQTGFNRLLDFSNVQIAGNLLNISITNPDNVSITSTLMRNYDLRQDLSIADTLPPSVPQNVSVISANGSMPNNSSMVVVWNASTDNFGVSGYQIHRSIGPNGPWENIGRSPYPIYSDTGLTDDVEYCYQLVAIDGSGNNSDFSSQGCNIATSISPGANAVNLNINQIESITLESQEEGYYTFLPNISGGLKVDMTTSSSTAELFVQVFDNSDFVDAFATYDCSYQCTFSLDNISSGLPLYLYIKNLGVSLPLNILIQKGLNDGSSSDPKNLVFGQNTNMRMDKQSSNYYQFTTEGQGFYKLELGAVQDQYGFPRVVRANFTLHTFEFSQKIYIDYDKQLYNDFFRRTDNVFSYYNLRANQTYFLAFQNPYNSEAHFTGLVKKGLNSGSPREPQLLINGTPYTDSIENGAKSFLQMGSDEAGAYTVTIDPPDANYQLQIYRSLGGYARNCNNSRLCFVNGIDFNTGYLITVFNDFSPNLPTLNYTIKIERGLAEGSWFTPVNLTVDQLHNGQIEYAGISHYRFRATDVNHDILLEEIGGLTRANSLILLIFDQSSETNTIFDAITDCRILLTETAVTCQLQNLTIGKLYYATVQAVPGSALKNPSDYNITVTTAAGL